MERICDSLDHVFARNRLVFWYDGERQWEREFEEFERAGIQKFRVDAPNYEPRLPSNRRVFDIVPRKSASDLDGFLSQLHGREKF